MPLRMRNLLVRPAPEPGEPTPLPVIVPPRRRRARGLAVLLAGVVAALGVGYWQLASPKKPARPGAAPLRTAKVTTGKVEQTLRLGGMTVADKSALIVAARLSGSRRSRSTPDFDMVIEKIVQDGTRVKKGDILAEFDRQHMLLRLDDYRASVVDHENNIKIMYARLNVRRTQQEQKIRAAKGALDKALLNLKTAPVRSAIQTERFRLAAEEARSRYDEYVEQSKYLDLSELASIRYYELDYEVSKLELRRAEANVEKMVIRSPIDGLAVIPSSPRGTEMRQIQQGDQIRPGETFMQVVDLSSLIVSASVNQVDVDSIRLGQRARIRVDAFPDMELPGKVVAVGAYARGSGWRRSYVTSIPVRLKFDRLDPRLLPNFSVSADVIIKEKDGVTLVPKECLFESGEAQRRFVYVRKGDSWERRAVEIGLDNNLVAEVLSGVQEGETLAAEAPPPSMRAAAIE